MSARPRARRKAERPGEILEAAFEEFSEKGFVGTRLEDVARRAGVTKGTIYVYFPTKEALFLALTEAFAEEMSGRIEAFLETAPQTGEALAEAAMDHIHAQLSDPRRGRMLLLVISEGGRFPETADANFRRCLGPLLERLSQTFSCGAPTEAASPLGRFPELICAPSLLLLIWRRVFGERRAVDPDAHLAAAKRLLLEGLRPRAEEKSAAE